MANETQLKKRAPATGPNLLPLKDYLAAQKLYQKGDEVGCLKLLSRAMGSQDPLTRLEGSLEKVFGDTPLSDMTLHLTLVETKKK